MWGHSVSPAGFPGHQASGQTLQELGLTNEVKSQTRACEVRGMGKKALVRARALPSEAEIGDRAGA